MTAVKDSLLADMSEGRTVEYVSTPAPVSSRSLWWAWTAMAATAVVGRLLVAADDDLGTP